MATKLRPKKRNEMKWNGTMQSIQIVLLLAGNFRPWFCIAVRIFANTILATNPIPYFLALSFYVHRMFVCSMFLLDISNTLTRNCVCDMVSAHEHPVNVLLHFRLLLVFLLPKIGRKKFLFSVGAIFLLFIAHTVSVLQMRWRTEESKLCNLMQ